MRCASWCFTTGCGKIHVWIRRREFSFFSGKAAAAYHLAKVIIKFINNLAGVIDADPDVRGRLKVLFLPDYAFHWQNG